MKKKMDPPYRRKEKYIKVKWRLTKDDIWIMYATVQFNYYGTDGLKHTFSQTFTSSNYDSYAKCMEAACACRNKALYERQAGSLATMQSDMTVQQIFDLWKEALPMTVGTYRHYMYVYRNYIQEEYGQRPLVDITELDVQHSINKASEKRNNRSVRYIKTCWQYLFRIAHMLKIKHYLDMDLITVPKINTAPRRNNTVTDEELQLICAALRSRKGSEAQMYDNALVAHALVIMRYCGLRPAEVYALNRSSITDKGILITEDIGEIQENNYGLTATKTPTSIRYIPLNAKARKELDDVMAMSDNEYIFTRHNGTFMNTSKASQWIAREAHALGIDFRSYDCRHQFATDLDLNGVSDRTRMELMGHANLNTTNSYARSNDQAKYAAVNGLIDTDKVEK